MSKITKEEVAKHKSWKDGNKDVWCIFEGKVYNVSSFLDEHPGGEEVLLDHAGGDMTQAFHDIGHSDYAKQVMNGLLVGDLVRTSFIS
jgi:cytochrome b involved in lipid metabolism